MRIPFPFIPPLLALCALSGCGDSPETLFAKAQEDFSAEDYKAARSQLIAALDEQPGNHRMLILLARTQLQLGDPDGAENVLGRLDRAGAKGPEVQRIRARVALMRKAPDKALALMGNDDTLEALRIRADAYLALGDDGKAKAAFERGMAKGG
ncbi:tetratricopeptide repeat protein [Novosphingobium colocasiae]